jgi:hypothetical protein
MWKRLQATSGVSRLNIREVDDLPCKYLSADEKLRDISDAEVTCIRGITRREVVWQVEWPFDISAAAQAQTNHH